jgi:CTP:molybdopterin cytidylyltransferase MocA
VFAPVDCPLVPADVFEALLASWTEAGSPAMGWLAPRFAGTLPPRLLAHGRYGHPVVLGRELLERVAQMSADTPLSELRAQANPLLSLDVSALATLDDLDRPADLERIRRVAELGERA